MLKIILVLNVFIGCSVYAFVHISNPAEYFKERDQQSTASLDNIGLRISRKTPKDHPEPKIRSTMRPNIAPIQIDLNNLDSQTPDQIERSLATLRANVLRLRMMNGLGGKTIVKYADGITLLAKDEVVYKCSGAINKEGNCNGSLSPFKFKNNTENYCYAAPANKGNNHLCFSNGNQAVNFNDIKGKISCSSTDNSTTFVITQEDYYKMCQKSGQPTYTYLADINDHLMITIPNENPYLKCQNNTPNVCIFT